jgi:hypothetical protein
MTKRQDRLKAEAAVVVEAMRLGQTLRRHHAWHGTVWWLSKDGTRIADEVAQLVVGDSRVVANNDALPLGADIPAQTFRFGGERQ